MSNIIKSSVKPKTTWKDLGIRAVTAFVLIAICVAPIYFGGIFWAFLSLLLGGRLIWEWVRMSDPAPTALSFTIPVAALVIAVTYVYTGANGLAIFAMFTGAIMAMLERMRRGEGALWPGLGFIYIAAPTMQIVYLRGNEIGFSAPGFLIVIFLMVIVAAADTGAYLGGSYFKGPRIAPKLSPKKTWSGFLSGFVAGAVMGAVCAFLIGFSPLTGALLAMPIVVFSVVGDFLESGFKRHLQVKDTGGLLPGHGGLLDRLDSLLMVVAVASIALFFKPEIWPV